MKLLKFILISVSMLTCLACPASDAHVRKNEVSAGASNCKCEFIWGPRASFDIFGCENSTDMSRHDPDEIGFGCSAGIVGRFMWNRRWFVESALQVSAHDNRR